MPIYYYEIDHIKKWIISESEQNALKEVQEMYGQQISITRENDVLDTWFSSALLPFSSLGWPEKVNLLEK